MEALMNPDVDHYLSEGCGRCPLAATPECKVHNWQDELRLLRRIVLDCGLTEERKWGVPCYTFQGGNVSIVSAFKDYCSLSFFKGSLLQDSHQLLEKPGENTQAGRIMRFTQVQQILENEAVIKAYIFEAIEVEKAGLKAEYKRNPEPIPKELSQKMDQDPRFKAAFEVLTPGRQRGYILFFAQPKQSQTREGRIEKCKPKIFEGKGLNDR